MTLETLEFSLRGWNWGNTEFEGSKLSFLVGNRPAFEVPMNQVANVTLPTKNEVSVEFNNPTSGPDGKKIRDDMLVEMRFYVPGVATLGQVGEGLSGQKQMKDKSEQDGEDSRKTSNDGGAEDGEIDAEMEEPALDDEGEVISKAALMYDTIKQRADVGTVQGEAIVTFQGLLCLTPRYFLIL